MELIDKIKQEQENSHNKWFERWFAKNRLEDKILQSASKGYGSFKIELQLNNPTEESKYLNRRLSNPKTIEKLKEKLPGIEIEFEEKEWNGFFGLKCHSKKILFSWR